MEEFAVARPAFNFINLDRQLQQHDNVNPYYD